MAHKGKTALQTLDVGTCPRPGDLAKYEDRIWSSRLQLLRMRVLRTAASPCTYYNAIEFAHCAFLSIQRSTQFGTSRSTPMMRNTI